MPTSGWHRFAAFPFSNVGKYLETKRLNHTTPEDVARDVMKELVKAAGPDNKMAARLLVEAYLHLVAATLLAPLKDEEATVIANEVLAAGRYGTGGRWPSGGSLHSAEAKGVEATPHAAPPLPVMVPVPPSPAPPLPPSSASAESSVDQHSPTICVLGELTPRDLMTVHENQRPTVVEHPFELLSSEDDTLAALGQSFPEVLREALARAYDAGWADANGRAQFGATRPTLEELLNEPHDTCRLSYAAVHDSAKGVIGVAVVKKGFKATLHHHLEPETYVFLQGTGRLYLAGRVLEVTAPAVVRIPGNAVHAMTPLSDQVVLAYAFPTGPFDQIEYTYLKSYL